MRWQEDLQRAIEGHVRLLIEEGATERAKRRSHKRVTNESVAAAQVSKKYIYDRAGQEVANELAKRKRRDAQ